MSIRKTGKVRVRRQPEAAREHILAAAEKLLIEDGPLALKLADVAAASDVANGTVLHHFESIDGLHAALMERMTEQLVANVFAAAMREHDPDAQHEAVMEALFDTFETRGAARLAAWLELTGEWRRLTNVREAVRVVAAKRAERGDTKAADVEDLVLVAVVMAMGAGLFGRSLGQLIGKPAGRARKLAVDMLRAQAAKLGS
ncbi:MAG: TetR family transcriptional regulator [Hyphomonadaceae bacterium]|nr:TetR family transcriptional regulator [Hyphomonadaceae bacterium]